MKRTAWVTLVAAQVIASGAAVAQTSASSTADAKQSALRVKIGPVGAVSAGAQWRADEGIWHNSGTAAANLAPGAHVLSFKPIAGWTTPANLSVTLAAGQTNQCGTVYKSGSTNPAVALSPSQAPGPAAPTGLRMVGPAPPRSSPVAPPAPPQKLRVVSAP
jgi:hypothetical protein